MVNFLCWELYIYIYIYSSICLILIDGVVSISLFYHLFNWIWSCDGRLILDVFEFLRELSPKKIVCKFCCLAIYIFMDVFWAHFENLLFKCKMKSKTSRSAFKNDSKFFIFYFSVLVFEDEWQTCLRTRIIIILRSVYNIFNTSKNLLLKC